MKKIATLIVAAMCILTEGMFAQGAAGFIPQKRTHSQKSSSYSDGGKRYLVSNSYRNYFSKLKKVNPFVDTTSTDSAAVTVDTANMNNLNDYFNDLYTGNFVTESTGPDDDYGLFSNYNSQTNPATPDLAIEEKAPFALSTLLSYNFTGKDNNVTNLTPEVFLGWNESVVSSDKIDFQLRVGPYFSSQLDVNDSSKFLPAMMTSGNVGLIANTFLCGGDSSFSYFISPMNLGMKLMSNFNDSTKTIIQHFYSFGAGVTFKDLISLTANYNVGWHNITSQSEENFKSIFKENRAVHYLNVWVQTKINVIEKSSPLYLYVAWRGFLNTGDYNYPNSRILTLGIQKNFQFPKKGK